MASTRRIFSQVPQAGATQKGEAYSLASPLSKSSSCHQSSLSLGGLLSSLFGSMESHSVLYRLQAVVLGIFPRRSSRPSERSKFKWQVWRKAFFHFFICFVVGNFIGLTPFVSMNFSINLVSKHQTFMFEVIPPGGIAHQHDGISNEASVVEVQTFKDNVSLGIQTSKRELLIGISDDTPVMKFSIQDSDFVDQKLLIIVTPTSTRPFQAYYLNRLAHTLRLVPPPLLWIVVEMSSRSVETADILRRTGVMYRHLVCDRNLTSVRDRGIHQRNVALSHIEMHRLDGIVYFADDDNMYSINLFEQVRDLRRFGTWPVAILTESKSKVLLEGPVCNGSKVVGWHTNRKNRIFLRFHAEMSGFAFNSTILWDPKVWHRPTLEPLRLFDTVKDGFKESMLIEQVVEDESQMEGLLKDCSIIMVWHLHLEASHSFYPPGWFMKKNLDIVAPLT